MSSKCQTITREKLNSLQEELNRLINVDRLKIIEEIKVARSNGDLSENADYESAINNQKDLEKRIQDIKYLIDNHVLIESEHESGDTVRVGSKVKILEIEENEEYEYEILGSIDNNPSIGRISNESPLAKSILGKKVGDIVEVQNIATPYRIKIVSIE